MKSLLFTTVAISALRCAQSFIAAPIHCKSKQGHSFCFQVYGQKQKTTSTLLDEFKIAGGELINPYKVLKVSRDASRQDIKLAYRTLSKKYHPDGVRHRKMMPGSCNNLDEVRDHWERIKLAYEILSDSKMRAKYERHSAISDPASAMGRAAFNTIGWGISGIGKGIFKASEMAASKLSETSKNDKSLDMSVHPINDSLSIVPAGYEVTWKIPAPTPSAASQYLNSISTFEASLRPREDLSDSPGTSSAYEMSGPADSAS